MFEFLFLLTVLSFFCFINFRISLKS
jgi:hypothetical protein